MREFLSCRMTGKDTSIEGRAWDAKHGEGPNQPKCYSTSVGASLQDGP